MYAWWTTTGGLFPDSVAYLLLAKGLVQDGLLLVAGFGHVDTALILPPLYPLLIGLGTLLYDDAVLVSQALSGVILLVAVVPAFLWMERATNVWLATATVAVIQWQPQYLLYGTSTLTEPLFILGIAATGHAAARLLEYGGSRRIGWFLLGAGVFLVFLVRHMGVFLLPIFIGAIVVVRLCQSRPRDIAAPCGLLLAGFATLAAPFSAVLQAQTGQSPWIQRYRLNQYVVQQPADSAAATAAAPANYTEVLVQRRQMRRLTPEGHEMLADVVPPGETRQTKRVSDWFAAPETWWTNLRSNVAYALAQLGPACLICAAFGVPLALRRRHDPSFAWRALVPGVVVGYLLLLSLVTGLVARYIEVLAPLVIALGFIGVHGLAEVLVPTRKPVAVWLVLGTLVAALFLLPVIASAQAPRLRRYGEQVNPLAACRPLVAERAGIFAFHPAQPYMLGGHYRVVPNDSLDRIAAYGRLTGTRWLLFHPDSSTAEEAFLYDNAPWLDQPTELFHNANFVPRCASADSKAVLFEITPAATPGSPGTRP